MAKLGSLKLKNRIFLAPMHQVNDVAFRLLCKKAGAGLAYTGLVNPQSKEKLLLQDKPAVQLACNSAKGIKEFIKKYDKKISLYDFNLGCPSPHAKQNKIGYFMSENLGLIESILKEIKTHAKKPITIKIRKMPEQSLKPIIKTAEKYCNAVSVHPRTMQQGYSGAPDLEFARQVRKITKLPLIYSGNIISKEQADKLLEEFDFIMIGRSAIGSPGIFSELSGRQNAGKINFFDWLKLAKKLNKNLSFSQVKFQAINFTKGFEGASKKRAKLSIAKTEKEILDILKNL